MSRSKRIIKHKVSQKDRDELSKGDKVPLALRPGDFGFVPKKLDLEGVTLTQIHELEVKFRKHTLYLTHRNVRVAQGEYVAMRYQSHNLYAVYKITDVNGA